ncbi:LacI family DNA-binding transcriptional regulator [Tropicimonas sp. IMCC34043]|uniref:LacI family DNA-binding transcriptional regulator n=1 Tax=Tropicimonas sp. IMCC34043 TaxID=2248760 RepID=UPI000E27BC87|nr:LacI family DNA-binding transcriptional regulator [Tropicimonas sp. IMCC34043]
MKPKRRPTLDDVASLSGVSAITVSRTIRSPEKVSERSRLKVQAAIEKLGYTPDLAASALASKSTNVIGLLVPSLTNNVFADVLRGVYDAVETTRYFVQIGNSRYSALKEEALIRVFLRQKPAGLIVAGFDQTDPALNLLETAGCPVVQIMDFGRPPVDMAVGFRHDAAARLAARHLLECGYRRPGILAARMDPRTQSRLQVFREVCAEAGVLDERRVVTTPHASSVGVGRQLLELLLTQAPDTDAVFCNNDDLAIGALMEAHRRNLHVPEDLGICGFNDLEMTRNMFPSLTSIATPRFEVGRRAVEMLLAEIEAPDSVAERNVDLGVSLIARDSTRRPR